MKKIAKIIALAGTMFFSVAAANAQVSVGLSIRIGPPALPVYEQPACPVDGYLWQPGYWGYDPDAEDYYWVPGVWVAPPQPSYYWTPPYWGFDNGNYGFHVGYWGPHVGFYGGINYGYGYGGSGFYGGRWSGSHFSYNTAVVRVNRTVIHNTYVNKTVIINNNNHYSFNGPGGSTARPSSRDQQYSRERHIQPTSNQVAHQQAAMKDRGQFAKQNHGQPAAVAMNRVHGNSFNGQGKPAPRLTATNNRPNADVRPNNTARPNTAARPNEERHDNNKRSDASRPAAGSRPNSEVRPQQRPQEQARPQQQARQQPQRPQEQASPQQQRPQPQARPQQQRPQEQARPQQQARPQPQRPQQQARPQQQPRPQGGGEHHHR